MTDTRYVYCANCNGTGEGMHEGTTCYVCRGHGGREELVEADETDEGEDAQ